MKGSAARKGPAQERDCLSTDRNAGGRAERVGDITDKPPQNKALDRDKATKLANLLEGLEFPVTKEQIMNHLNKKSPNGIDVVKAVENNLDDHGEYSSAYDIEMAAGLVEQAVSEKPYVRDKPLNRANRERIGEKVRPDPYAGRENIQPASARDVSPNTPKGEEV